GGKRWQSAQVDVESHGVSAGASSVRRNDGNVGELQTGQCASEGDGSRKSSRSATVVRDKEGGRRNVVTSAIGQRRACGGKIGKDANGGAAGLQNPGGGGGDAGTAGVGGAAGG